jgi:hypothetical protein
MIARLGAPTGSRLSLLSCRRVKSYLNLCGSKPDAVRQPSLSDSDSPGGHHLRSDACYTPAMDIEQTMRFILDTQAKLEASAQMHDERTAKLKTSMATAADLISRLAKAELRHVE